MTLTETVFWTKIASKFVGAFVVLIIVGYYAYIYVISLTRTPEQVFRPDNKCGSLPEIAIEAQEGASYGNAVFQVTALSTSLPDNYEKAPLITYVYKTDVRGETFETRDLAYSIAKDLEFETPVEHAAGSTVYVWRNKGLSSTLTFNTDTFNFTYLRDNSVLPKIPNTELPGTTFKAPEYASNYLRALGLYTAEFANGKSFSYPVVMSQGKSFLAESLFTAQLVRVDFQKVVPMLFYDKQVVSPTYNSPALIDFVKFIELAKKKGEKDESHAKFYARRVGRTPETANVQVYLRSQVGNPARGLQQLIYNNWKVEETPCGTASIIRPSSAILKIQKGEGTIAYLAPKGGDPLQPKSVDPLREINLYNLELTYYEANTIQPYLQPIYVATGEVVYENGARGDIAIYVPAIDYGLQPKK
ncbi:MAG: hypothetical protein ACOYT9_01805 [Patescibacteria group bacterium]